MEPNKGKLLPIEEMPQISSMDTPDTIYTVIRNPAILAGMRIPSCATPWKELYRIGLRQLICLTDSSPDYPVDPLTIAGHYPLQDLYGGILPADPAVEFSRIQQASDQALSLITRHIGVVIHCTGGTGRSGTVIGCILKGLGYNTSIILSYLDQINRIRGARRGWPESIWQAEAIRKYGNVPEIRG